MYNAVNLSKQNGKHNAKDEKGRRSERTMWRGCRSKFSLSLLFFRLPFRFAIAQQPHAATFSEMRRGWVGAQRTTKTSALKTKELCSVCATEKENVDKECGIECICERGVCERRRLMYIQVYDWGGRSGGCKGLTARSKRGVDWEAKQPCRRACRRKWKGEICRNKD